MSDFQPLVIGNRVNFPELNRRVEVEFEDGERTFTELKAVNNGRFDEILWLYNNRAKLYFNANLKWRYADQDQ